MHKIYLFVSLNFLITLAISQNGGLKLAAVETNALSFVAGHIGPEVRFHFGSTYQESTIFLGYRYAFTTLGLNDFDPNNLSQYAQSLSAGHDFTIGIRVNSNASRFMLNFLLQGGSFKYDNEQLVCTNAAATTIDLVAFCRCDEVSLNRFTESALRVGGALEAGYTLYRKSRFQVGLSIMLGFNFVSSTIDGFTRHATCQISQQSEPQVPQWLDESGFMLHGIPRTRNLLTEELSRFNFAMRTGLWITYTIN